MKLMAKTSQTSTKLERFLPWILIVAGVIGLLCSFMILTEKIHLLQDPSYDVPCDINPVISCGSVMQSDQSNVFGFTNPIVGVAGFPVLTIVGVAMLAGARFKRWFWLGLQVGLLFALGFVHWLFYQTVYNISSLCPYCMVVWAVTIPSFWYVLLYNLRMRYITLPAGWSKFGAFLQRHHLDILALWYLVIIGLILQHFWYYFGTLL